MFSGFILKINCFYTKIRFSETIKERTTLKNQHNITDRPTTIYNYEHIYEHIQHHTVTPSGSMASEQYTKHAEQYRAFPR